MLGAVVAYKVGVLFHLHRRRRFVLVDIEELVLADTHVSQKTEGYSGAAIGVQDKRETREEAEGEEEGSPFSR